MLTTYKNALRKYSGTHNTGVALSVFVAFFVLFFCAAPAKATLILNDTFSDGERATQNLPNSAHWYSGGPTPNMSVSSSGLTFRDATAGKATALAYFTPTQLQVGASLTLSFNYSFTQTATNDNSFMFGLYDSGGNYASKDSVNFGKLDNYTGYATSGVFGTDTSVSGSDHIEARNQPTDNLLSLADYDVGTRSRQNGGATPGEIYAASMKISRTAAGITVESQIGNTTMQQTYSDSMFTTFDTIGVFAPNGDAGSFTMDNIKLDYMGAPEPSSFFALGFFGLALIGKALRQSVRDFFLRLLPRLLCF